MTPRTAPAAAVTVLPDLADMAPEPRQRLASTLLRALNLVPREADPDFAASVADGFVEGLDEWTARINHTDNHGGTV